MADYILVHAGNNMYSDMFLIVDHGSNHVMYRDMFLDHISGFEPYHVQRYVFGTHILFCHLKLFTLNQHDQNPLRQ